MVLVATQQTMQLYLNMNLGPLNLGFTSWRPTLYAYILFTVGLSWGMVLTKGEHGKRILFVLPAALRSVTSLEGLAAPWAGLIPAVPDLEVRSALLGGVFVASGSLAVAGVSRAGG